jgi:hypothetical protein
LTLTQFLYVLGGSLIDYMLFQSLARDYMALFVLIAAPIALIALGLAFFKVQEQPLSHFIMVGILYMTRPKIRIWKRLDSYPTVLTEPPKEKEQPVIVSKHHLEKSELEMLAYNLDVVQPTQADEKKKMGAVTSMFEQLLKEQPQTAPVNSKK